MQRYYIIAYLLVSDIMAASQEVLQTVLYSLLDLVIGTHKVNAEETSVLGDSEEYILQIECVCVTKRERVTEKVREIEIEGD